jgi:hypothetical protein
MRTIINVDGFDETSPLGCGKQERVVMEMTRSPFYANRVVLKIGEGEEYYFDLDDLSNAVAMFVFEKELLNADS